MNVHRRNLHCLIASGSVLLMALVLCGFAGLGDYDFDLPNGYMLSRSSAHNVEVVPRTISDTDNPGIPPEVTGLAWNGKYVMAEQVPLSDGKTPLTSQFWILDTVKHTLYGPIAEESEFVKLRNTLGISHTLVLKPPSSYPEATRVRSKNIDNVPWTVVVLFILPALIFGLVITAIFMFLWFAGISSRFTNRRSRVVVTILGLVAWILFWLVVVS